MPSAGAKAGATPARHVAAPARHGGAPRRRGITADRSPRFMHSTSYPTGRTPNTPAELLGRRHAGTRRPGEGAGESSARKGATPPQNGRMVARRWLGVKQGYRPAGLSRRTDGDYGIT